MSTPRYTRYISTDLRRFMFAGAGSLARKALSTDPELKYYGDIGDELCCDGYVRVVKWWLSQCYFCDSAMSDRAINRSNLQLLRLLINSTRCVTFFRPNDADWLWANAIRTGDIAIFDCMQASGLQPIKNYFPSDLFHTTHTGVLARSLNPNMVTRVLTVLKHTGSIEALRVFAKHANAANLARYLACVKHLDEFWDATVSQALMYNNDLDAVRMCLELLTKSRDFYQVGTASAMSGSLGGALLNNDEAKLALLREYGLLDYAAYTNMRETMIELNRSVRIIL